MSLDLPPPNLSGRELEEWLADEASQDRPETVRLPELAGFEALSSTRHFVFPPGVGTTTDEYVRLYPFFWFACQHPDRATDEAMLIEGKCRRCTEEEWARRGLPVSPLPPLPGNARRFR